MAPGCMQMSRRALIWSAGVVCMLAAGCGRGNTGPRMIPVSGSVVSKGAAAGGCSVGFRPDEGQAVRAATAVCDAAGRFKTPPHQGLMPGRYTIVIHPAIIVDEISPKGRLADNVPEKYTHWDTSDLKVEVGPHESSKRLDIVLRD